MKITSTYSYMPSTGNCSVLSVFLLAVDVGWKEGILPHRSSPTPSPAVSDMAAITDSFSQCKTVLLQDRMSGTLQSG